MNDIQETATIINELTKGTMTMTNELKDSTTIINEAKESQATNH